MKGRFLLGAAVAAGTIMLIPGVALALSRAGRPLTRAGLKTGAYAMKEFQKAGAEVYEHVEDLLAEVRAEFDEPDADEEQPEAWEADVTDLRAAAPRTAPAEND